MSASELSSSSVSPSEKYSCSLSPLKLTNGSTAMECGGGLKAAALPAIGAVCGKVSAAGGPGRAVCFESQNLSATKYAQATAAIALAPQMAAWDNDDRRAEG